MTYRDLFRAKPGKRVDLGKHDTHTTAGIRDKSHALALLQRKVERIAVLQDRMFADARSSLLIILQAMDAAGKDSTIRHVMSGIDPRGCHVQSFGPPSKDELGHDYLWRTVRALPARGHICVHNRSHYEEVVITKVHQEILASQRLPRQAYGPSLFDDRYRQINAFERHLTENGTVILKFFLHVSRKEQAERLLARMKDPDKHWKVQLGDLKERQLWKKYRNAYEEAFHATSTKQAPWYVIPADHKWFTWFAVASIIEETLDDINPKYPKVSTASTPEWAAAQRALEKELK